MNKSHLERKRVNNFIAVASHEARLLWRSRTVIVLFTIIAIWVGAAVQVGNSQRQRHAETLQRLNQDDLAVTENVVRKLREEPDYYYGLTPYAFQSMQHHAALPPGPLAALDVGQSDVRTSVYALNTVADRQPDWERAFLTSGPLHNESALRIGRFDTGFMVVYILPLMVIALSFGVIAIDREKGSMRMVLSQPVSMATLLWASLLVRFLLLEFAVLLATAFFVYSAPGAGAAIDTLPRFLLWCILVTAYLAFWFAIAAFVVSTGGRSSTNALVLMMVWLFLCVVLPGLISMAGETLYPVPPRSEIARAMNITRDEVNENWQSNEAPFRLFYKDFPEFIPKGATVTPTKILDPLSSNSEFQFRFLAVSYYAVEKTGLKASAPHRNALRNQRALVHKSRLFSPVVAVREGLMDIAGTGDDRYVKFDQQVNAFWNEYRYAFMHLLFRETTISADDYHKIPFFHFKEEKIGAVASRLLPGLCAMLLMTLVLTVVTILALRRNQSPLSFN